MKALTVSVGFLALVALALPEPQRAATKNKADSTTIPVLSHFGIAVLLYTNTNTDTTKRHYMLLWQGVNSQAAAGTIPRIVKCSAFSAEACCHSSSSAKRGWLRPVLCLPLWRQLLCLYLILCSLLSCLPLSHAPQMRQTGFSLPCR